MPVQLTYTKRMRRAKVGLVAWDFGSADLTSVVAQAVIPFGNAVVKGTAERTGIVGSDDILGFAVTSMLSQYAINNFVDAYGPTEMVAVLRSGYIWVQNKGTVALVAGDPVYVNATGQVVNAAAAGAVMVPGSVIEKGAAIDDFVLLRVQTGIPAATAP